MIRLSRRTIGSKRACQSSGRSRVPIFTTVREAVCARKRVFVLHFAGLLVVTRKAKPFLRHIKQGITNSMVDELTPQTTVERAYVQARKWSPSRLKRWIHSQISSKNIEQAAGYQLALIHQHVWLQEPNLETDLTELAAFIGDNDSLRENCVYILCHIGETLSVAVELQQRYDASLIAVMMAAVDLSATIQMSAPLRFSMALSKIIARCRSSIASSKLEIVRLKQLGLLENLDQTNPLFGEILIDLAPIYLANKEFEKADVVLEKILDFFSNASNLENISALNIVQLCTLSESLQSYNDYLFESADVLRVAIIAQLNTNQVSNELDNHIRRLQSLYQADGRQPDYLKFCEEFNNLAAMGKVVISSTVRSFLDQILDNARIQKEQAERQRERDDRALSMLAAAQGDSIDALFKRFTAQLQLSRGEEAVSVLAELVERLATCSKDELTRMTSNFQGYFHQIPNEAKKMTGPICKRLALILDERSDCQLPEYINQLPIVLLAPELVVEITSEILQELEKRHGENSHYLLFMLSQKAHSMVRELERGGASEKKALSEVEALLNRIDRIATQSHEARQINSSAYFDKLMANLRLYGQLGDHNAAAAFWSRCVTIAAAQEGESKKRALEQLCQFLQYEATEYREKLDVNGLIDIVATGDCNVYDVSGLTGTLVSSFQKNHDWSTIEPIVDKMRSVKSNIVNEYLLAPLLANYAFALEQKNDIAGSEKIYLEIAELLKRADKRSTASHQLNFASFYLRQNMPIQAQVVWHGLLRDLGLEHKRALTDWLISNNMTTVQLIGRIILFIQLLLKHGRVVQAEALFKYAFMIISETAQNPVLDYWLVQQFMRLVNTYIQSGSYAEAHALLAVLIQAANEQGIAFIDDALDALVRYYIAHARIKDAEAILRQRLSAPGATAHNTNRWRIKLSEIYLVNGNLEESEEMFNETVKISVLSQRQTDTLRRARIKLLNSTGFVTQAQELEAKLPKIPPGSPKVYFALFGIEAVRLSGNSYVGSHNSNSQLQRPLRRGGGAAGHVGSGGRVKLEGNAQVSGGISEGEKGDAMVGRSNFARSFLQQQADGPPVVNAMEYSVHPPLAAPENAIDNANSVNRAQIMHHKTGMGSTIPRFTMDLKVAYLNTTALSISGDAIVRYFITDDNANETNAAIIGNAQLARRKPYNFQIWYDGARDIIISGDFSAIIYAPSARVRIQGNSTFLGAIVAREIDVSGNSSVFFDTSLYGMDLEHG